MAQEELSFHAVIGKFHCAVLVRSSPGQAAPVSGAAHTAGPPSQPGPARRLHPLVLWSSLGTPFPCVFLRATLPASVIGWSPKAPCAGVNER